MIHWRYIPIAFVAGMAVVAAVWAALTMFALAFTP
jgi:hypothetical protein